MTDTTPPTFQALWERFASAKTPDAFCQAWLALVCEERFDVRAAAVLMRPADSQAFAPTATWPTTAADTSRLTVVVEQVLRERKTVSQSAVINGKYLILLSFIVEVAQRVVAVVALETGAAPAQAQALLQHAQWGSAWLGNLLTARELEREAATSERLSAVLGLTATALRHKQLHQSLQDVVNALRAQFESDRVALGLTDHSHVKFEVLSDTATIDRHAPLAKAYLEAMEEAFDEGRMVVEDAKPHADRVASDRIRYLKHIELLKVSGATQVVSVPLLHGAQCVGILVVDRSGDQGFEPVERNWLEALAAMLGPVIVQRRAADRSSFGKLMHECKSLLVKLFGAGHLLLKVGTVAVLTLVAILALVHIDYRVPAKAVIEGEVQRVAAAPFDGFISASFVRAGDTVRQGQPLAQLDDRELKIEQAKWSSERDQVHNKLREAMASHDLTAVQVLGAQLKQAEAQLALVEEKLDRARLVAPYDGVVVSGDLSQQIGAPVETGKKLFEISPLARYRVVLQVDEREIRHVLAGQQGHLVITGIAGDPMPLNVVNVTPVATAQEGKNFFRVEARLAEATDRLRPGMEGVGKIETGRQSLWWILTHSFTDWLRVTLWGWRP